MNIERFTQSANDLGVLGVMVSQGGEIVAEHAWDDLCRRNVYSASKSVTATAVGLAIDEGLVRLDEKLTDAFPEEIPAQPCEALRRATVRDLLTMGLGQAEPYLMGASRPFMQEDDWVRGALAQPCSHLPGERFLYSNTGPYLAGILVQRRAGCDLVNYLLPRLFAPLGITRPTWETDRQGFTFGAGGLMLSLPEMHKLGRLWLQEGAWEGKQLVSREWIRECAGNHIDNGAHGYGYLFWRGTNNSWRADGKYCQLIVMYPDKEAVITLQSECRRGRELFQLIDQTLFPLL